MQKYNWRITNMSSALDGTSELIQFICNCGYKTSSANHLIDHIAQKHHNNTNAAKYLSNWEQKQANDKRLL